MKTKMTFKKALCVILSFVIVVAGIPLSAIAATSEDVKFGHLSDIHYFAESAMGETEEDKAEFREILLKDNILSGYSPEITDAALANLAKQAKNGEIEFLLISGDLTRNSEIAGHKELAEKLAKFEEETGIEVYVTNGNHDINNSRAMYYDGEELINGKKHPELRDDLVTSPDEFEEIYKNFGFSAEDGYYSRYKAKGENSEGSLSYAIDVSDDYRLITIDSQRYSADNTDEGTDEHLTSGQVSDKLLAWAVAECEKAQKDGKTIIGMTHTNVIPHFDTEVDILDQFVLYGWEKVADALAAAGMHYIVSGHTHMQEVASHITDSGETITDIVASSILSYPNMYRTIELNTYATGRIDCTYNSYDVDEDIPVYIDGVAQTKPFKYFAWANNFGGDNIKNFVNNMLEYQLKYGFGKDVKDAGGLYKYVTNLLDFNELMSDLTGSKLLGGVSATAIKTLLLSLCNQVEDLYLSDPQATIEKLSPMLDKLLSIEISDYPSTIYKDTLGFGSSGDKGTIGDLASTVLANHCINNEDPNSDKFLQSALERFDNGENAEIIVDGLATTIIDDLLCDTILEEIKLDPVSLGIYGLNNDDVKALTADVKEMLGNGDWLDFDLNDLLKFILVIGVFDGDTVSDVVFSFLDEYLTESQYDIIDQEFYRIMKDFTHDENPGYMADHDGKISYTGAVEVPLTQNNLRLPSHISVTLGEDATERNINYYTKYSITDTDIQIVPYSNNPDFSNGTTVDVDIDTDVEVEVLREWPAIDLGFIGIIYHKEYVNRHYVKISGLEENTKYCYRLGDAEKGWWSEVGVISTEDGSDEFSFFHISDAQSTTEKQYNNVFAPALQTAFNNHDADFIINTGDNVDDGRSFMQWKRMFNSASDILMDVPMMSASGNHEEKGDYSLDYYFNFPNVPEQDKTTGVYYSFDYNNAHFAVLNSNNLGEDEGLSTEQIEWLKADMNGSDADWKFVAIHKAPYSNGSHFDDDDVMQIREQLMGLMPELGIDIVFQGHDHVYMRTDIMNNNEVVDTETKTIEYNGLDYTVNVNPDGTVYSINGTIGVKHYKAKDDAEVSKVMPISGTVLYLELPSYSYIQIDGDTLYFDSYEVDGDKETRIDQFAIQKDLPERPETDEPVVDEPTTDKPETNAPVVDNNTTTEGAIVDNPVIPNTSAESYEALCIVGFMLVSVVLIALTFTKKKKKKA